MGTSASNKRHSALGPPMFEFEPVPRIVFTPEEACRYLRLDEGREMDHALRALNRLVDEKKAIRPCLYRQGRLYLRSELDRFLGERMG